MHASPPLLNSRERAALRRRAHQIRPTVHVGKGGVTAATISTVEQGLSSEELLKIKVLEHAPDTARDTGEAIASRVENATVVQVMGRVVTLYRPLPEKP